MSSNQNLGANSWGYLFKPDKSATPLLEQLCLGIAKIIVCLAFHLHGYATDLYDGNRANSSQVQILN